MANKRNTLFLAVLLGGIGVLPLVCALGGWEVLYETNFSRNPRWTTDQPDKHYWDSQNQWYHVRAENSPPGYPSDLASHYAPNRYAGTSVPDVRGGFRLQWDMQVTHSEWSAGMDFGVFDSIRAYMGRGDSQGITVSMSWTDSGNNLFLHVCGSGGLGGVTTEPLGGYWQPGDWCRFQLTYDPGTNLVALTVTNRETGTSVWNASMNVPGGGFSHKLIFLGNTRYGCVDIDLGGGLNPYAADEGNLDNVALFVSEDDQGEEGQG